MVGVSSWLADRMTFFIALGYLAMLIVDYLILIPFKSDSTNCFPTPPGNVSEAAKIHADVIDGSK